MSRLGTPGRTLTHSEARAFYDRFSSLQGHQPYERRACDELIRRGDFANARAVLELGCGTGRLAERLLASELPHDARYLGVDLSARMVDRTRRRLARFGARAEALVTDGSLRLPVTSASRDRFVAAYVFELLSEADARLALDEAYRVLAEGGRLCAASLSWGTSRLSRAVSRIWDAIHGVQPMILGGCRPIDLRASLAPECWDVLDCRTVVSCAIPTQVVIATPRRRAT